MTEHVRLGDEVVALYRFGECLGRDHRQCPAERDVQSGRGTGTTLCSCECHIHTGRTVDDVQRLTGLSESTLSYLVRFHFIGEHGVLASWDDLAVAQCLVYGRLHPTYDIITIIKACRTLRRMPRNTWRGQSLVVGQRGAVHCVITHPRWWDGWTLIALDDIIRALEEK